MKNKMPKIVDEATYRKNLLNEAKIQGCERELLHIFNKYDMLLRNCTNDLERKHIGMLGVLELSKLLDNGNVGEGGSLIVNGETIIEG
jgi:hypothetical protein